MQTGQVKCPPANMFAVVPQEQPDLLLSVILLDRETARVSIKYLGGPRLSNNQTVTPVRLLPNLLHLGKTWN